MVKRGDASVIVVERDDENTTRSQVPAFQVSARSAVGSGDVFAGVLAARLAQGEAPASAARWGFAAAAVALRTQQNLLSSDGYRQALELISRWCGFNCLLVCWCAPVLARGLRDVSFEGSAFEVREWRPSTKPTRSVAGYTRQPSMVCIEVPARRAQLAHYPPASCYPPVGPLTRSCLNLRGSFRADQGLSPVSERA